MGLEPGFTPLPKVAFFHENSLRFSDSIALPQLGTGVFDRAEQHAPDDEIQENEDRARHNEGENPFALIHALIPGWNHRGFPSKRNCAWLFGKICGGPISN